MTSTALYTTLGGLVNEVLLRVLDEIEEQTDISEEESIRLNKLSKMLHDLEGLFDGSEVRIRVLLCFSSRRSSLAHPDTDQRRSGSSDLVQVFFLERAPRGINGRLSLPHF